MLNYNPDALVILETACKINQTLNPCHDNYKVISDDLNKSKDGSALGKGTAFIHN